MHKAQAGKSGIGKSQLLLRARCISSCSALDFGCGVRQINSLQAQFIWADPQVFAAGFCGTWKMLFLLDRISRF